MAKTLLDLSDIVVSPEFCQTITVIKHSNGRYENGIYIEDEEELTMVGVVSATDEKELQQIPEGDRTKSTKTIHVTEELTLSEGNSSKKRSSDLIKYNGNIYRIISLQDASDYGYYKAIVTRLEAD